MSSGHVFAQRIRHHLRDHLTQFIADGKLILGICNGFQVMTKMGLLPGYMATILNPRWPLRVVVLFRTIGFKFASKMTLPPYLPKEWVQALPFVMGRANSLPDPGTLAELEQHGCVAARYVDAENKPTQQYPDNPNGSLNAIAGLSDPTGQIFGMMPHPEAYLFLKITHNGIFSNVKVSCRQLG